MDLGAELSACKPVEGFMLMLLERVAALEDTLQRIEHNLNDPLHGLHATDEFLHVRKAVLEGRGNGFHKFGLRSKPTCAAIQALNAKGYKVWEVVTDRRLMYRDFWEGMSATQQESFVTKYECTTGGGIEFPDPSCTYTEML